MAVAAPAAEEGLCGSDAAEMVPEPEVAMVSVPPDGEAVSHASHESSEFEFGGAQPPSPADGQAEDEDVTESLSIEELAQWLDGRGILAFAVLPFRSVPFRSVPFR